MSTVARKQSQRYGSDRGAERRNTASRTLEHPFGSSANPMDFAQRNTVEHNHIVGGGFNLIRNSDPSNIIRNNTSN